MATSGGHLLVTKAMRLIRFGVDKARLAVRERLNAGLEAQAQAEAHTQRIYARVQEKPLSRLQAIRQNQSRNYTTTTTRAQQATRHFTSESAPKVTGRPRPSYTPSRAGTAILASTGRTPFASTLRPNLTGGAIPRTASGYGAGGARYFSHGPAAPAEVINSVSQAVRAFWLQGHRARFDGFDQKTGHKRYRAISPTQEKARNVFDHSHAQAAGSYVDFKVSPTITAVGPLASVPRSTSYDDSTCTSFAPAGVTTIADEATITQLQIDFSRALKSLSAIMNDLKRLSTLGSLPLLLIDPHTLRVRFPGCDRDTVEVLCTELGVRRGAVGQDEEFDTQFGEAEEMALRFPFAPSKTASEADLCEIYDGWRGRALKCARTEKDEVQWCQMLSAESSIHSASLSSASRHDFETVSPRLDVHRDNSHAAVIGLMTPNGEIVENPWQATSITSAEHDLAHHQDHMSDYSSLRLSDCDAVQWESAQDVVMRSSFQPNHQHYMLPAANVQSQSHTPSQAEFEGIQGIYRFIEECDRARR